MIYAIRCPRGPVKFGFATDPKERLGALQIGHHQELYLLASQETKNDQEIEKQIHELCSAQHIRGEWFKYAGHSKLVAAHIYAGSVESYLNSLPKATIQTKYPFPKLKEFAQLRHFLKRHAGRSSVVVYG